MFQVVKMPGGMLVLGGVAAPNMPALQTQAEMNPGIAELDALLADVRVGSTHLDLIQMRTLRHRRPPTFFRKERPNLQL
jgi:hypothetical protein